MLAVDDALKSEDLEILAGEFVHVEITKCSSLIPKKLFQFERAIEFRKELFQGKYPKSVVLVVNSSLKTVKESVASIDKSNWSKTVLHPHIFSGSNLCLLQTICQSLCIARRLELGTESREVRTEIFQD